MKLLLLLSVLILGQVAHAYGEYVNGYYKQDGTYVNSYYRSPADNNPYNNYSSRGNINPYTGERGNVNPYNSYNSSNSYNNYNNNYNRNYRY